MSIIRPVDMNGMINKSQDLTSLKQNENNRGFTEENVFQHDLKKEVSHHMKQVNDLEEKDKRYKYPEKDKKGGKQKDGKKRHTKDNSEKEKQENEKVILKETASFDVKI